MKIESMPHCSPSQSFEPVAACHLPPSSIISLQGKKDDGCLSWLFKPFIQLYQWLRSLFCPAKNPDGADRPIPPKLDLPEEIDIQGNTLLTNGHIFKYLLGLFATSPPNFYFPRNSLDLLATPGSLVGHIDQKEVARALSENKICFFPMREGPHWTCVIINPNTQTIGYYDSKGTGSRGHDLLSKVNEHLAIDYHHDLPTPRSIQPDGYQCALWILYFLKQALAQKPIEDDFDIAAFREEVQQMLIDADSQREKNLEATTIAFQLKYGEEGWNPAFEELTQSLEPFGFEVALLHGPLLAIEDPDSNQE